MAITGRGLGWRFRRSLEHDFCRYEALRRKAAERGLVMSAEPGLRDPLHLSYRLGSLAFDAPNHPVRPDSRAALALRGAWTSRTARLPPARRLLLAAWFLAVGFLPRRMAASLISWRMVPDTRPAFVGRSLRRTRSLLR